MEVTCTCGKVFEARSAKARYCSDRCRKNKGKADVVELARRQQVPESDSEIGVYAATLRELTEADRVETALGQSCLRLARRLDSPGLDTGSAMATVATKLDDLLAKATRGAGGVSRPGQLQDELAARRAKHG